MTRIPASTWAEIRTAYASGIGLRELARNMGIPAGTVLARSKREGWTHQIAAAKLIQRPELARGLARPDAIDAITPMQSAALSTQERKAQLLTKSLRIADKAADRIENQIDTANISQATIAFGVSTDKALLLAGAPTQIVQVNLATEDIYSRLNEIAAEITNSFRASTSTVDAEFTRLPDAPNPALGSASASAPGMDSPSPNAPL